MKIIDLTPFLSENGEISLIDKARASLKFGSAWLDEIQSQKSVIAQIDPHLPRSFTLLRNLVLPGTGAMIPLILVGPAGIQVMQVTNLTGTYTAKGDAWGTNESGTFRQARLNLVALTARMARAVQVYLERQGLADLLPVEGILLSANPGLHVDSVRPIIRVVMRDALERFAIALSQSRALLAMDTVEVIINRLQNPKSTSTGTESATPAILPPQPARSDPAAETSQAAEPLPAGLQFFREVTSQPAPASPLEDFVFNASGKEQTADRQPEPVNRPQESSADPAQLPVPIQTSRQMPDRSPLQKTNPSGKRRKRSFTLRQWLVLFLFMIIEIIILIVSYYLFAKFFAL